MSRRLLSRAGGFVHDINTVMSLSDEPTNIRLLSDKSLYILQNLSQADITFLSRYGEMLTGDLYLPVLPGSAEEAGVQDAVDIMRKDLNSMGVEELLECICANLSEISEQAEAGGEREFATETAADIQPSDGQVSVGPGEKFATQEDYFSAKCNAANGVFDTVLGVVDWLDDNHVDLLAGLFGGVTTGLIAAAVAAGPVGWGVVLAVSTVSGIASLVIRYSLNFGDISDALGEQHSEIVAAMYSAGNAIQANENFLIELDAAATSITSFERQIVDFMLPNSVLNQLFDIGGTLDRYESLSPISCGSVIQLWSFVASGEGWAFRDDSTGTYTAFGQWIVARQAWEINVVGLGVPLGTGAIGTIYITGLGIAVSVGNSIQFDHGATSDGVQVSRRVTVIFSDVTEQTFLAPSTPNAGTVVMSIGVSKTIASIEIAIGRSSQSSFDATLDVTEVRVV